MIDVFNDIERKPLPLKDGNIDGLGYLDRIAALQIGQGSKVFRGDESGIWLGGKKWADAPFRVDMLGNLVASSATFSGYATDGSVLKKEVVAQVLSGSIYVGALVGTAGITLDGANNRIVVNDGTNPRIIIGNI